MFVFLGRLGLCFTPPAFLEEWNTSRCPHAARRSVRSSSVSCKSHIQTCCQCLLFCWTLPSVCFLLFTSGFYCEGNLFAVFSFILPGKTGSIFSLHPRVFLLLLWSVRGVFTVWLNISWPGPLIHRTSASHCCSQSTWINEKRQQERPAVWEHVFLSRWIHIAVCRGLQLDRLCDEPGWAVHWSEPGGQTSQITSPSWSSLLRICCTLSCHTVWISKERCLLKNNLNSIWFMTFS